MISDFKYFRGYDYEHRRNGLINYIRNARGSYQQIVNGRNRELVNRTVNVFMDDWVRQFTLNQRPQINND